MLLLLGLHYPLFNGTARLKLPPVPNLFLRAQAANTSTEQIRNWHSEYIECSVNRANFVAILVPRLN